MYSVAEVLLAVAGSKPPGGMPGLAGEEPALSPDRLRILIVEDDTIIAWTLEALLLEIGHEIVGIAPTGERALALAGELEPDLVMMDINLGSGINGIEAAEGIRRRYPAHVVFVSAYGDPDTRAKMQQAVPGAPILTKPVDLKTLARALANIRRSRH